MIGVKNKQRCQMSQESRLAEKTWCPLTWLRP
jgi:hypothetical protein